MTDPRSDILTSLGTQPTMAKTLAAAAKLDRLTDDGFPTVRYAILRNVTLEPGLPAALKVQSALRGMRAVVSLGEFNAAQQEMLDPSSHVYTGRPDIIVVAQQLQTLAPRFVQDFAALSAAEIDGLVDSVLNRSIDLVAGLRERSSAMILVHNFESMLAPALGILDAGSVHGQQNTIRALNIRLAQQLASVSSCYVVDVDHLLAQGGLEASLDDRYWHIGRAPYTFAFCERLAREYVKFGAALKGKTKKCLVLDCDNTLWGGVIGEDGMNGIALGHTHPGSAFVEFQAAILSLYHRGVLLAVNSKNNYADAYAVFEHHPNSLLRPDHFVSLKINWTDKVTNLQAIAQDLNIGLDSLVFVDDNAFECRYVRENLPDVTVIELPPDPTRYARLLRTSGLFDTLALSDEDRRRSEMYRSEARRSELRATAGSMDDYLASLGMVLTIARATPFSVPRIAQLTQKTNQFNLTTKRYSEGEIAAMMADPAWQVYYAELEDRFDRAGIIAVVLVHDADGEARIDTLLMSCRVIGRGVEQAIIASVAAESARRGQRILSGAYVPTAKNGLVSDFYASAGFSPSPAGDGVWRYALEGELPAAPAWFAEIRFDAALVEA